MLSSGIIGNNLKHSGSKASFSDFTLFLVSSSQYDLDRNKCPLLTKVLLKHSKIKCLISGSSWQIEIRETGKDNFFFFTASFLGDSRCYCVPLIKITCELKKRRLDKDEESEQLQQLLKTMKTFAMLFITAVITTSGRRVGKYWSCK